MKMFRNLLASIALTATLCAGAADPAEPFDPMAANIEENIANPPVGEKDSQNVAAAMSRLATSLKGAGYDVDYVRRGEVIMVTLPCSRLFAPNSVSLIPTASKLLAPLVPYVNRTDNYKIILAVHSDNTGDEMYSEKITADRANAIDEYFYKINGNKDTDIIPYGLGADEPVAPNTGIANREKNRRVEIYFVPTAELIEKTKRN